MTYLVLEKNRCQPRILRQNYSSKNEGQTKTFWDKQKLEFIASRLLLQETLKSVSIDNNLKSYKKINAGKDNYKGKQKI